MAHKKSMEMIQKSLETQLRFLESSSRAFDEGFEDEAQRLATSIRVLLHDGRDPSVFMQLEIKNNFKFITSASPYLPSNAVSYTGLVGMSFQIGGDAKYFPISKNVGV